MSKIISKIGISEFKDCLNSDTVKAMTKDNKENVEAIGMTVMLDMGSIILSHVSDCETELYKFLSDLTGETVETLKNDFNYLCKLFTNILSSMVLDGKKKLFIKD